MFRQETPAPPVAAMGGTWIVTPRTETSSHVRLLHNYRAIDDTPAGLEWIDNAVDRNSRAELAALKHNVEVATGTAELALSFTDGIEVDGSAKDMYDFVNEAAAWRERLPHVADVDMRETTPGLQTLRMDTQSKDGSRHTTESVRVCFPNHRIVYKQTTLPALMNLHTGCWRFTEDDSGVTTATSQHTVVINPDTIAGVLGPGSTVDEARTFVRDALGGNSRATLGHAKAYAEARR
jgi:aromatase